MTPDLVVPVTARDHAIGPEGAPITLVEYGDLQCPHCALVHPLFTEIREQLAGDVRHVFRHFPLEDVHPHAAMAAMAAEAAAGQGRFWKLLDIVYEDNSSLDAAAILRMAKKAGVNSRRLQRELDSGIHAPRVRADQLGGRRSGVRGTPTLFINGARYAGTWNMESLVGAIETGVQYTPGG
ncbi:MAG: DsbA family protein [Gemmatimonadales bacterium]